MSLFSFLSRLPAFWLFFHLSSDTVIDVEAVDILSSSTLQRCITTQTSTTAVQDCQQRLLIQASIQNGDDGANEFVFDLGGDNNTIVGTDGKPVVVADSMSVTLRQSAIRLIYPTRYESMDMNNLISERVVTRQDVRDFWNQLVNPNQEMLADSNPCRDSGSNPTCGYYQLGDGSAVPGSQGFCCRCTKSGVSVDYPSITRSGVQCEVLKMRQSAHCPVQNVLWYSVYSIGAARLDFGITMTVRACRPRATVTSTSTLRCTRESADCVCSSLDTTQYLSAKSIPPLGPQTTRFCFPYPGSTSSDACDIEFRLEGTFASYAGTASLESKFLLVPSYCSGTPSGADADLCDRRLRIDGPSQFLLVDRSQVSMDGSGCNKAGIGWTGFNAQAAQCTMPVSTCFDSGQPHHLYTHDFNIVAASEDGWTNCVTLGQCKWFLEAFFPTQQADRDISAGMQPAMVDAAYDAHPFNGSSTIPHDDIAAILRYRTKAWELAWSTTRFQKTQFTLTVKADPSTLRFMLAVARGKIMSTTAPAFEGGQVGHLEVVVANVDNIAADFALSFYCPPAASATDISIATVPGVELTLQGASSGPAASQQTVAFELRSTGDGSLAGVLSGCMATLMDALGRVTDSHPVTINVTQKVIVVAPGQGGTHTGGTGLDGSGSTGNSTDASATGLCNAACGESVWDLSCAVKSASACTSRLLGWGGGLLGFGVAALLVAKLAMMAGLCSGHGGLGVFGLATRLLRTLCCCGRGGQASATTGKTVCDDDEDQFRARHRRRDRDRDRDRDDDRWSRKGDRRSRRQDDDDERTDNEGEEADDSYDYSDQEQDDVDNGNGPRGSATEASRKSRHGSDMRATRTGGPSTTTSSRRPDRDTRGRDPVRGAPQQLQPVDYSNPLTLRDVGYSNPLTLRDVDYSNPLTLRDGSSTEGEWPIIAAGAGVGMAMVSTRPDYPQLGSGVQGRGRATDGHRVVYNPLQAHAALDAPGTSARVHMSSESMASSTSGYPRWSQPQGHGQPRVESHGQPGQQVEDFGTGKKDSG